MLKRSPWRVAVLLLGLWLVPALPAQAGLIPDPTGDTFNTGTIDITGTEINVAGGTVTVTLKFAAAVAAPSAFAPNSVSGFIDLDTNSGPGGTAPWGGAVPGGNNWINFGILNFGVQGPTVAMGDEFYIDLGSEAGHPGLVDIVSTATNLAVGVAPVSGYGTNMLMLSFNAGLIGYSGGIRYGVLVGDFNAATDRAPNGETALAAVPEPSTLLLAGMAGVGALAYRARRRK
jgi:hypothetical protein